MSLSPEKGKSHYDPSRYTVGKIYRDLQMKGDRTPVIVGDMSNEMIKDMRVDLEDSINACLKSGKYQEPFYMMIHQKKDLQMPSAILRRMIDTSYRPWPEDDTDVFKIDPKSLRVFFCWSLPHWSEMDNMIANQHLFSPEMVFQIKAWKDYNLRPFGFYWHPERKWIPNPNWKDQSLESYEKKERERRAVA